VDLTVEYMPDGRAAQIMLLLTEIRVVPELKLGLPFPSDGRLARHCRAFLRTPTAHDTIDGWSEALG
jgi:hypothetical protein